MNRLLIPTVLALAIAASMAAAGAPPSPSPTPSPGTKPFEPIGTGTDYAIVDVGSRAPDFSFETDGRALRLRDLRAQGHVLLVFAADEPRLVALERERERLLALGVVPVAILDRRPGLCAGLTRRLNLHFPVVADPRRVIGAQFNALDPSSGADAAAWFVLDRNGRVRDFAHETWPVRPWTAVASSALGLPAEDASAPASNGRR